VQYGTAIWLGTGDGRPVLLYLARDTQHGTLSTGFSLEFQAACFFEIEFRIESCEEPTQGPLISVVTISKYIVRL